MNSLFGLRTSWSFLLLILTVIIVVAAANSVYSQSILKLYGQVIDKHGPVADAIIAIKNTSYKSATNHEGFYYFYDIPPGEYRLSCGFGSVIVCTNDRIAIGRGVTVRRDIFLGQDLINSAPIHVKASAPAGNGNFGLIAKSYQLDKKSNQSVKELIGSIPGLNLISSPATGETYISANGIRSEGVNILIDGRELNSLLTGRADLEQIPLNAISKIEYYSPGATDAVTDGGLGGTVNLVTKRGGNLSPVEVSISRGSFGDENYVTGINYSKAGYGVLNGIWENCFIRNDYNYIDRSGDDKTRLNAFSDRNKYFFSYSNSLYENYLSLSGFIYDGVNGVPGRIDAPSPNAISNKSAISVGGELSSDPGKSSRIMTMLSYLERKTLYNDYESWIPFDTKYHERELNLTSGFEYIKSEWLKVNSKLSHEHSMLVGQDFIRPTSALRKIIRNIHKVSGNLGLMRKVDRISLSAGLSSSFCNADNKDYTSTSLTSSIIYEKVVSIGLRSSYANSFRLPGLAELHWREDVFVMANPDLKPEQSRSFTSELFAAFTRFGDWRFSIEYRDIRYKDLIYWRRSQGVKFKPVNVSNSDLFSTTFIAGYKSPNGILKADFSRVRSWALNREEGNDNYGKFIIHQPLYVNTLWINLNYGGVYLTVSMYDSGKCYFLEANTKWLKPYTRVNLSAGVEFKIRNVSSIWDFKIDNFTDIDYELLEYQPMPPRSFHLGMTIKL
ncbi:MAG: TonB-dependent receptor [candidate division Zixibacteria bacterium]|nr:TonB-dependent receptor [candidate division Zixibacteria bacterium]